MKLFLSSWFSNATAIGFISRALAGHTLAQEPQPVQSRGVTCIL